MEERIDLRKITNFINDIEIKYNLFDYKIDGIYFWKLIRMSVWSILIQKTGLLDSPHPPKYKNVLDRIFTGIKQDYNIIRFNALRFKKQKRVIIFKSPRKVMYMGNRIDSNTFFIEEEMKRQGYHDYESFEIGASDEFVRLNQNIKFALNSKIKMKLMSFFTKIMFSKNDIELLNEISKVIKEEFSIEIDIKSECKKSIIAFKIKSKYYNKLFSNIKPEKVILVCSYGKEALISMAQRKGIQVFEIQHGTMSKHHLGYSFQYKSEVPYFPDKLLLFGRYWIDSTPLPLKESDTKIIGYQYLNDQLNLYRNVIRNKNSVLFLSQGNVASKLINIAYQFAINNLEYNVVFKLHPSEYRRWRSLYPLLIKAETLDNFKIVDNSNISLYKILAESEFQVGVSSTAIFEGLAVGVKTVLINLPGFEYMEYLIEKEIVMVAKDSNSLESCIKQYHYNNYSKDYFFKTSQISNYTFI